MTDPPSGPSLAQSLPEMPGWTIVIAALFAPLVVWLLWRLQILSVEVLRGRMLKLLRHQAWLYNTVSWIGTLLHELSHATVLLLSGHGIKQFRVRADSGHVLPRRMRNGPVGFLFFLVAALAPLFGPPLLALVGLWLLVDRGLWAFAVAGPGLNAALQALETTLVQFPRDLVMAMGHLDLTQVWHVAAFAAILLGMPGSRPSHVKGSRFHGKDDEGDIAVVRKKIRKNPWPLLVFLALVIAAYYPLTRWAPAVYWYPVQAIWMVAITAVVLALFGALWWSMVAVAGSIRVWLAWVPPAAFVAVQVLGHQQDIGVVTTNLASLAGFLGTAVALRLVASRPNASRRVDRL